MRSVNSNKEIIVFGGNEFSVVRSSLESIKYHCGDF